MAITKEMLDAERELRRVEHLEYFEPRSEAEWANEGFEDGWNACLAFLREHGEDIARSVPVPLGHCGLCGESMNGAPFVYHAECPTDKRVERLTFVRVEIPAK